MVDQPFVQTPYPELHHWLQLLYPALLPHELEWDERGVGEGAVALGIVGPMASGTSLCSVLVHVWELHN